MTLKLVTDDEFLADIVPSEKYQAEFPQGKIPYRDSTWLMPHLKRTEDLLDSLEAMLFTHDKVTDDLGHESVSSLLECIDAYNLIPRKNLAERKEAIKNLLGEKMPIRFLLGLVGETDGSSILHLFTSAGHGHYDGPRVEAMLDADERIIKGESHTSIMRATGLTSRTVTVLESIREQPITVGYEGALRHAFFMLMEGMAPAWAWQQVLIQHNDVARDIAYDTVYSLRRADRFARNVKRFGWTEGATYDGK